jgi:hypothetical protein
MNDYYYSQSLVIFCLPITFSSLSHGYHNDNKAIYKAKESHNGILSNLVDIVVHYGSL